MGVLDNNVKLDGNILKIDDREIKLVSVANPAETSLERDGYRYCY